MPEWAHELFAYGPLGIFAAFICWLGWKFAGKIYDIGERHVVATVSLCETLEKNSNEQIKHCADHTKALQEIDEVLHKHDDSAVTRAKGIDELILLHTDESIPRSTAKAISTVERIRKAAYRACILCRQTAESGQINRDEIKSACLEIEQHLKEPS